MEEQVHVVGSVLRDVWEDKETKKPRSKLKVFETFDLEPKVVRIHDGLVILSMQVNVKEISLVAPPGSGIGQEQSMGSHIKSDFYQNGSANRSNENKDQLWRSFFENPGAWWDNRASKRNDRQPDFKHKESGTALWMISRGNPEWVIDKLLEDGYIEPDQRAQQ